MKLVEPLLARIRALPRGPIDAAGPATSDLSSARAATLTALGRSLPPEASVAVPAAMTASITSADSEIGSWWSARLHQTANEETLTGTFASLAAARGMVPRAAALQMVATAVALRASGQERPWFPGDDAPSSLDLQRAFGLRSVLFDPGIPAVWRPYYRRQLAIALADVRRVLPDLSVDGLGIAFQAAALPDSDLALHDPRTRTIKLSITTSAGTLAHELAHDLDWQTSRRLFGATGYSTDRAAREGGSVLGTSMRGLAPARTSAAAGGPRFPADRPTEVFARGVDWFVATELADQGRTNGVVSAVQDPLIYGYATTSPSAIGGARANALLSALGEMTDVPDSMATRFAARWSDADAVDPVLMVDRTLHAPILRRRLYRAVAATPSLWATETAARADACTSNNARPTTLTAAMQSLEESAIQARARGTARGMARRYPVSRRPLWARSVLGVPPYRSDAGDAVAARLAAVLRDAVAQAGVSDLGFVDDVPAPFTKECSPREPRAE